MSGNNGSDMEKLVCDQVEYYFGDINLPRDKFLQEEMKKDVGWIALETMLKFHRLAAITTDIAKIADALEKSHLIEVSDDKTKIRRDPEVPMPENTLEYWQEIKKRTAYAKGFPLDTTLDEILKFVRQSGEVHNVLMRKTFEKEKGVPRVFKGSVFITFKDLETAKHFIADESTNKFNDIELIKKMQEEYWVQKREAVQKSREEAKAVKQAKKVQMEEKLEKKVQEPHYVAGSVLKISGFTGPSLDYVAIKEFFQPYGEVAYVDSKDPSKATLRLHSDSEGQALIFWEKALAGAGADGKVNYNGQQLSAEVMTGDEEKEYWANFAAAKADKMRKMDNWKGQHKNKNRGRDADGGKFARGKKNRKDLKSDEQGGEEKAQSAVKGEEKSTAVAEKRHADDTLDAELPKKSKRIVFTDEEEENGSAEKEDSDVEN